MRKIKKRFITLTALIFLAANLSLCSCQKTQSVSAQYNSEQMSKISDKLDRIASALASENLADSSDFDVNLDEEANVEEEMSGIDDYSSSANGFENSLSEKITQKSNKTSSVIPSSVSEIVSYYTKIANLVKKDKPGFTGTETPSVSEIKLKKESSLANAIQSAAMKFVEPSELNAKKGTDHSSFPISGQNYVSKLEPSFVKTASLKQNGIFYEVYIVLKDEARSELPSSCNDCKTGSAVNVLTKNRIDEILGSIPLLNITKFAPTYSGCYIKCKINSKTEKMVSATYFMNNTVEIEANGLVSAMVTFSIKQEFKINY